MLANLPQELIITHAVILKDETFLRAFINEYWLGRYPLNSGDGAFITRRFAEPRMEHAHSDYAVSRYRPSEQSLSSANCQVGEEYISLAYHATAIFPSGMELERSSRVGVHCEALSNPEFLSERTTIQDVLYPSRVLIGSSNTPSRIAAAKPLTRRWVSPDKNHHDGLLVL
ncbi:hypothetical protein AJ80_08095 [Polytolypa hystricis UAMH7299]|uniref:Uncharacterized protein n=1 Tax=Polytolypa hystricis (strain UAMH7299) TaxID=1447883 RepID=A0A2B7XDL1_POLH7|nr:hypothetical protein AJ80_08095 [Polytolypa hystricis UAMH7299]